jgi:hypothetical protein
MRRSVLGSLSSMQTSLALRAPSENWKSIDLYFAFVKHVTLSLYSCLRSRRMQFNCEIGKNLIGVRSSRSGARKYFPYCPKLHVKVEILTF